MDGFILLAPLLFLPIVMLLAFVGCSLLFSVSEPEEPPAAFFQVTFRIVLIDGGWPSGPFTVELDLERDGQAELDESFDNVPSSETTQDGAVYHVSQVVVDDLPAGVYRITVRVTEPSGAVVVNQSDSYPFTLEVDEPAPGTEPVAEPRCLHFIVQDSAAGEVTSFGACQ